MTVVNPTRGVELTGSTGSIAVYFDRANPSVAATFSGSIATYFDPSAPTVKANYGSGTYFVAFDRANPAVSANYGSGTFLVAFDRANPSVSIGGASSSIGVFFDRANPAVNLTSGTLTSITNTVAVYFDRANPAVAATFSGSIAVYYDQSNPKVNLGTDILNISSTAIVPQTASGSTSTAGNTTVINPEANRNIKVYAYALTTTGVVSISPRFTTGASAGATERWRVAMQAPASVGTGANLAIQPPGYLFATGTGNTLALYLDSATLVHYSVAYYKESA